MLLILKVVLTVTVMICVMLVGFVVIAKLNISNNTFGFLTMFWIGLCLYVPKILFGGEK